MAQERLLPGHIQKAKWILVPVSDITTPQPGRIVYGPRWWAVTDDDEVLFFQRYTSPQCNADKAIVEHLTKNYNGIKTTARFLPLAYLPHRCSDYA
jgi:hypothetical protein